MATRSTRNVRTFPIGLIIKYAFIKFFPVIAASKPSTVDRQGSTCATAFSDALNETTTLYSLITIYAFRAANASWNIGSTILAYPVISSVVKSLSTAATNVLSQTEETLFILGLTYTISKILQIQLGLS